MRRLLGVATSLLALALMTTAPVLAQTEEAPNRRGNSTFLGDTGLWFVPTAEVLSDSDWSFSGQRVNFDRQEGISDIQHYLGTFAYGIRDRMEVFGSIRFISRIDRDSRPIFDPTAPDTGGPTFAYPFVNDQFTKSQFGDMVFGAKYALSSERFNAPMALAIRGTLKLPSGSTDNGVSTGEVDAGIDLIGSRDLGPAEVSAFGGFVWRGDPNGVDLPNSFRWGLGAGIPIRQTLSVFAELTGDALSSRHTIPLNPRLEGADGSISSDFPAIRSPVDLTFGLQYNAPKGLYVGGGLNIATVHAERQDAGRDSKSGDRMGFLLRIGYHPGVERYVPPPPPPAPDPPNRPPTVDLTCDPCEVLVGGESMLRADASDPDGDPLEYAWSAPAGTFQDEGNRETNRWTAPDASGPVPVTVTVDDGRGGMATDTTTITVNDLPPVPIAAVEIEDVHFDFDRFSLRPGAGRVLDQLLAYLEEAPSRAVQIAGHTCNIGTAEYNLALGERRANSVEEYLTSRGVDPSRITTISFGEEQPAHDNSREETRRLNRRAAMTVSVQ